jgi:hypothetical protein
MIPTHDEERTSIYNIWRSSLPKENESGMFLILPDPSKEQM